MKIRNKKTGEILEDVKFIDTSLKTIEIHYLDNGVLRMETERDYHSFLQNWEDYDAPKEPFIKDEKIRKAVRAWAEVNAIKEALYAERPDRSLCLLTDMGEDDYNIDFVGWIPTLKDGESYTIAELCGEEGE